MGLVTPGQLPHNLALATRGLLLVFDADVFDAPHDAIVWIHLLAVAAVLAALVAGVRHLRSSALEDFVPQVLLIVCALDLAVFVFTSQPFDLASSRFLSPFAICGAALAGRMLAPLVDSPRVLAPAAAAAALLLLTVPVQLSRPPAAVPTARVESWLEARGLTRGLGAYWESSIVTLDTGGRVTVRCVDGPTALERRARPDRWFQNQAWFAPQAGGPADFVVFSPGEHTANINEAGAIEAFGQPIEIDHIGPYEVMVYSRDLTPELGP